MVVFQRFQKQDVFCVSHVHILVEQYPTIRWFCRLPIVNWIITIKWSWTKLPYLFYRKESIQRRIFVSRSNTFALLTFRQGQISKFNRLDETRSLFSNMLTRAPAVRVITLFHLPKIQKISNHVTPCLYACSSKLRAKICDFPLKLLP